VTFSNILRRLWEIHLRQWNELFPKKPVAILVPFEVCFEGDRVVIGVSPDGMRKVLGRRVSAEPVKWKEPGRLLQRIVGRAQE